ncbi:cytochrome P450 [Artemisia annua]|uniref:Cytochrome P450 n=1 Tax=Artemisia annua TaxID=35608 RepID=A0A2U1LGB3_ARTAN|nr:cytochrome P450 [Artemisia annua]
MEVSGVWCGVGVIVVILVWYALKFVNWVWFKPRKMEKLLRKQGLKGSSYRFLFGDLKDMVKMLKEAKSKPINLTDDIVPRVMPFYHKNITAYGKVWFTWMGPRPMVHITEPAMVKEILANNYGFQKARGGNPLVRLLVAGLADAETDRWMDVWPYLQTLSSDVISRTAFGSSFEEGKMIFELQRQLAVLLIEALQTVYIPGSRFLPTKSNKRMKEIGRKVKTSIRSIIDRRILAMKAGESGNDDLLGILLDSNLKEIKEQGNSNFGLSIDDVIEEYWQARARDEVSLVFGEKKPDVDGLSRLKIINMIFNEVLRLYPPVVLLNRMVHQETKLGDITLPAGCFLQLHTMLLHNDHDIWGDDAKEFNHERFSEGVSNATKGQAAAYLPFGGGPRICIGQNFSLLEANIALAVILQQFSFELSPSYSHAPHTIITLQPQFGAHLILQLCKQLVNEYELKNSQGAYGVQDNIGSSSTSSMEFDENLSTWEKHNLNEGKAFTSDNHASIFDDYDTDTEANN